MIKRLFALITILFSLSSVCYASINSTDVIYGDDNRVDVIDSTNSLFVKLASSTAAMVFNKNIQELNNEQILLGGITLGQRGMCKSERFSDQPSISECSGFLVGPNLLVTAGHCMTSISECQDAKWIFDYKVDREDQSEVIIDKKNVFSCKKVISKAYDSDLMDYALIELDRAVQNRDPLKLRTQGQIKIGTKLVVIGNPTGLPTKIADGGVVKKINSVYFEANLDTYHGNSGSAVFNAETGVVEGILVRGQTDFISKGSCQVSNNIPDDSSRGEGVTLITNVKGLPSATSESDNSKHLLALE